MRAGSRHRRQAPVRSMTGATGDLWKRWNKHFYLARNTKECAEMHVHALHKKESDATHTSLSSKGSYEKLCSCLSTLFILQIRCDETVLPLLKKYEEFQK